MFGKNLFLAIEGLDGSGKSTQIGLLMDYLNSKNIDTKFVHFPRVNSGVFGELIAKFLRGEFGNVDNVHPQLVALLFAEDRKEFSSTISNWLNKGYFVLVDRYVNSNIAFQCAKTRAAEEKDALVKWINMFEYEFNKIPKPSKSIYLDVPFSFVEQSLVKERIGNDRKYLNGVEDIHEKDISLQLAVKYEYEKLVTSDTSITKITCYTSGNEMKSKYEIHEQILSSIDMYLTTKLKKV